MEMIIMIRPIINIEENQDTKFQEIYQVIQEDITAHNYRNIEKV